jgi:hypothetical protein
MSPATETYVLVQHKGLTRYSFHIIGVKRKETDQTNQQQKPKTLQLSKAIAFEPLLVIPRYFVFVALAAWLATFIGLFWSWIPRKTIVGRVARLQ